MNILALDFSPTPKKSSLTSLLLSSLVEGMKQSGAAVEVIKVNQEGTTVKACSGCFHCWTITPNKCSTIKDYMSENLFKKWKSSDLVVYATPIYNKFMTASMKSFLERLQPAGDLGHLRGNSNLNYPDTVMVSTATYHGRDEFSFLSEYMNNYYSVEKNSKIVAELYRPQIKLLASGLFPKFNKIITQAYFEAGKEIIDKGYVTDETIAAISHNITDLEKFNKILLLINRSIKKHNMTHKVFIKKKPPLDVTNVDEFILLSEILLSYANLPSDLQEFTIVMNFDEGPCSISFGKEELVIQHGEIENYNLKITTDLQTWMRLMSPYGVISEEIKNKKLNITAANNKDHEFFGELISALMPTQNKASA